MREPLFRLQVGEEVFYRRRSEKNKKLAAGPCWWVVSRKTYYLVAEEYGGESMRKLIAPVRVGGKDSGPVFVMHEREQRIVERRLRHYWRKQLEKRGKQMAAGERPKGPSRLLNLVGATAL